MYIQLHPSVSMKTYLNGFAVYHLWGYTYVLGEILWKLGVWLNALVQR